MAKITMDHVKNFAKIIGGFAILGLINEIIMDVMDVIPKERIITHATNYSDVVKAVMDSTMWSEDKKKMINIIQTGRGTDYYESVMSVVNSTMWSNDKYELVKSLSDK